MGKPCLHSCRSQQTIRPIESRGHFSSSVDPDLAVGWPIREEGCTRDLPLNCAPFMRSLGLGGDWHHKTNDRKHVPQHDNSFSGLVGGWGWFQTRFLKNV